MPTLLTLCLTCLNANHGYGDERVYPHSCAAHGTCDDCGNETQVATYRVYAPKDEARPAEAALMDRLIELEAENEELKIANLPLYSDRIANLEAEIAALRKAFEDAPHDPRCSSVVYRMGNEEAGEDDFVPVNGPCDCWKARIPDET